MDIVNELPDRAGDVDASTISHLCDGGGPVRAPDDEDEDEMAGDEEPDEPMRAPNRPIGP